MYCTYMQDKKYVQRFLLIVILAYKRIFSCAGNGDWQQRGERRDDSSKL
jgi:hypothetical protein